MSGELELSLSSIGKIAVASVAGAAGVGLGRGIARLGAGFRMNLAGNVAAGVNVGLAANAGNNLLDRR
jgi:hypothetical protein